jgi:putative flavoprotein involved in K+ transport
VGAGNSGADIAMELAKERRVWLSGPDVGHVPFRIDRRIWHPLLIPFVLRVVFHRILTVKTPVGRRARPKKLRMGDALVRVKPIDLERAGVERVPRTTGTRDGLPLLADGRVLEPANVIWCTGFHAGFEWIDLPVHGDHEPLHRRGVVESQPGLYFVGLRFLHAVSSSMIHGVGRDAERIAGLIAERVAERVGSAPPSGRDVQPVRSVGGAT